MIKPYLTPEDIKWSQAAVAQQRLEMTDAEKMLEVELMDKTDIRFMDQVGFWLHDKHGNYHFYILDFYIPDRLIGIEVDGGYHYIKGTDKLNAKTKKKINMFNRINIDMINIKNEQAYDISTIDMIREQYNLSMPCQLDGVCSVHEGGIYVF